MKKLNFWLLASLFVAAFTVVACGDEGDDVTDPPIDNPQDKGPNLEHLPQLVGSWYWVKESSNLIFLEVLTLNEDQTFQRGEYQRSSSDNFTQTRSNIITGTFALDGLSIPFTASDGTVLQASFSGETLTKTGKLRFAYRDNRENDEYTRFTAESPEAMMEQLAAKK